jgi:hypothetical protein
VTITLTATVGFADATLPLSAELPHGVAVVQVEAEQIGLFGRSGGTSPLVVRGVNGTTAAAHASSTVVTPVYATEQSSAPLSTPITSPDVNNVAPFDFSGITPGGGTAGDIITTGTAWVAFTGAGAAGGKLLLENGSATGEFATWRMRARYNGAATASGDGGNSIGTTSCIDASASAQHADYGVLKAVNAVAQPNAYAQTTDATNIVTALYGRIDATAASVGRRWVAWVDTHATTKADAGDFLVRLSHNGTVANDGVFTIYNGGRMPVLFNFEDIAGCLSAAPGTLTPTHKIAVNIAGVGVRYLQVGTVA